jgi:hypothetical protein
MKPGDRPSAPAPCVEPSPYRRREDATAVLSLCFALPVLSPIFGPLGERASRDVTAMAAHSLVTPQVKADKINQPARILFGRAIYRMQHRETESFGIGGRRLHPHADCHGVEQSASDPLYLVPAESEALLSSLSAMSCNCARRVRPSLTSPQNDWSALTRLNE